MSDSNKRVEVLISLLENAVTYHNHKELMAYAATTLYVAAAAAVTFSNDVWKGLPTARSWVLVGVMIGAWVLTDIFVVWQLRNRAEAARRVASSMNDLVAAAELSKDTYGASPPALRLPESLTHAVLAASMLVAVIVVLATC